LALRLANGFDKKYGRAKEQPCDKRELSCAGARETSALLAGHQGRKLYFRPRTGVPTVKDNIMTVARITEISSVSKESFQDAILQGVERANKTLKNVKGAWIKDQEVTIDNGKVTGYKVILKVTFILSD
jgi:flavin-binding protein dodecin